MNANPEAAPAAEPESDNVEATDAVAAKPARRRRAVKTEESSAPEALQPPAEAAAPEGEATPAKPRRRRASAAPAEPAAEVPAQVEPAAESVDRAGPAAPVDAQAADPARAGESGMVDGSDGRGDAQDDDEGPSTDGSRRRRGRRDRKRGEGREGGDAPQNADAVIPARSSELFAQVVSGEFDVVGDAAATEAKDAGEEIVASEVDIEAATPDGDTTIGDDAAGSGTAEHKRVLQPEADAPKLHKVLAQSGIGSRRDMEQLIQDLSLIHI